MFKYSLFSFLSGAVFSHRLSIGLVLNRRTLAAAALYETYNIPIVKKIQSIYCFFSERKLYGFPQSVPGNVYVKTFDKRLRLLLCALSLDNPGHRRATNI